MPKVKMVQCHIAGTSRFCESCPHGSPHTPNDKTWEETDCTTGGECVQEHVSQTARCKEVAP